MKKYDIGVSIVLILISIYMMVTASGYNEAVSGTAMGPGVWVIILCVIMIILSVILLLRALFGDKLKSMMQKKSETADTSEATAEAVPEKIFDFKSPGMKRLYITFGVLAVFILLLELFGFYIAVAFLLPAIMAIFGERRWWMMLAVTAGALVFIYVVFVLFLSIRLPQGIIF
ncbi:MAG: tripartite tricarboxylate transporter TctB family protein [Oscillospiraceae bacterium]|nr:tripartite tricarboxylate transporter TctB family protein [Oscillospiraceae bacterium]